MYWGLLFVPAFTSEGPALSENHPPPPRESRSGTIGKFQDCPSARKSFICSVYPTAAKRVHVFPPHPSPRSWGRTTLSRHAPSPRKHTWAQGRRALLPTTPSALAISICPLTPPFGSPPSAPQTWVPKGRDSVSAPRFALMLGAHLEMKESVLPPQAAAPWPQDSSAASPGRARSLGSSQDCRRSWEPPPCQSGWSWISNPLRIRTYWTTARRVPEVGDTQPWGGVGGGGAGYVSFLRSLLVSLSEEAPAQNANS